MRAGGIFMKKLFVMLALVLLAGCVAIEKGPTTFEPLMQDGSAQVFRFKTIAGTNAPPESASAEEMRMKVLEAWLEDNALAGHAYEIVSRKLVVISTTFGPVYNIYYDVRVQK